MDRLQKKCIIASTAAHSLLVGLLLFGSALMPAPKDSNFKPITIYSADKVSMELSSGGSPDAVVPPSALPPVAPAAPKPDVAPPLPKPQPEPPKPKLVEPVSKPTPEPPKVEHHSFFKDLFEPSKPVKPTKDDTAEKPKAHKIEIDKDGLKPVVRNKSEKADQAQAAADAKARTDRKRAAQQIASAYKNISKNLSSSTVVELTPGVGGPGEVSVNYRDLIASKYYNAWNAPVDLDDATPPVTASVTIDRDGNVKSARITTPSGNRSMDRSIQNVLETVTSFEPFPAGSKEQEKTFTIRFNLQAKRATG